MAHRTLLDKAGLATLSVLDLHDAVAAGDEPNSGEYLRAWRAARLIRSALIEEMRKSLRRP
ncbi:hypothetical protein ACFVDU_14130 [Streptomyces albidoflavus]